MQIDMAWCSRAPSPLYSLALFVLFGIFQSSSEATDRIEGVGSIDCPHSLTVQWNEFLKRPPYVETLRQNSTNAFDGLFPSNAFAFYQVHLLLLLLLSVSIYLFKL